MQIIFDNSIQQVQLWILKFPWGPFTLHDYYRTVQIMCVHSLKRINYQFPFLTANTGRLNDWPNYATFAFAFTRFAYNALCVTSTNKLSYQESTESAHKSDPRRFIVPYNPIVDKYGMSLVEIVYIVHPFVEASNRILLPFFNSYPITPPLGRFLMLDPAFLSHCERAKFVLTGIVLW